MKTSTMVVLAIICATLFEVSAYFHHGHQDQQQQYDEQPQAQDGGHHHLQHHHEEEHYVDYHGHPKYHFDYAVHDPHTHDIKQAWEHRDGKHVKGEYKVLQPDGKTRVVQYEGGKDGMNYNVQYFHSAHHN